MLLLLCFRQSKRSADVQRGEVAVERKARLDAEANLAATKREALSNKSDADASISTLQQSLDETQSKVEQLQSAARIAASKQDTMVREFQDKIHELETELQAAEAEVATTKQELSDSRAKHESVVSGLKTQLDSQMASLDSAEKSVVQARHDLEQEQERSIGLETDIVQVRQEARDAQLVHAKELQSAQTQLLESENIVEELQQQLQQVKV